MSRTKLPTLVAGLATAVLLAGCGTTMDDDFDVQPAPSASEEPGSRPPPS